MKTKTHIDEYIDTQPKEVQTTLRKIRDLIKKLAPTAEEKIGYGIPTFKLKRNLVHFAAFPDHIGFYPTPSGIRAFEKELAKYKKGKGSVQFPLDKPIPYALIEKIVKYRVQEETT
jgi:uncharacterized protein YdhG (YjbR/CyaY superfamily)